MAHRRRPRSTLPTRALLGPLAVLAGGMVAGVMLWRFLMLEPPPGAHGRATDHERLSPHDREALEALLDRRRSRQ
jgi:hypothetical protein